MRKKVKNFKNRMLSATFAACIILMVSGCYTAVEHPIRTLVVEIGCMGWLTVFAYANGLFKWE